MVKCPGELSTDPHGPPLTATNAGDQEKQHKARGPIKSMAAGQDARAGHWNRKCAPLTSLLARPRLEARDRVEDSIASANISCDGEDRHGSG